MKDLQRELEQAEWKAWDSLARYKFQMFGYWAAIWVHLNRLQEKPERRNPFKGLVCFARNRRAWLLSEDKGWANQLRAEARAGEPS